MKVRLQQCWCILLLACLQPSAGADTDAKVDELFSAFSNSTPGCSVAVSVADKLVLNKAYGLANLDHNIPNTTTTRFYAASTTKQFTAAAIGLLVADKKLSLSSNIRQFVPELPAYADHITIDHLLHHTDGLRDYFTLLYFEGKGYDDALSDAEVLALLTKQQAPNFAAGSEFLYSNSGYRLLAKVVESVTGTSLAQFAAQRLFEPLGMTDTEYVADFGAVIARRAEGYVAKESRWLSPRSRFAQIGPSGVVTTTSDFLKWTLGLHSGALGEVLATSATTPGRLANGNPVDYGYGLFLQQYRGQTLWQHGGARPGYHSNVVFLPEQQLAVALLCNTSSIDAIAMTNEIITLHTEYDSGSKSQIEIESHQLQRLVGTYSFADEFQYQITKQGAALFAQATDQGRYQIYPLSPLEYYYKVADIRVVFDASNAEAAESLTLYQEGRATLATRSQPVAKPDVDSIDLSGTYTSKEISQRYIIYQEQGTAFIRVGYLPPLELRPVGGDHFTVPGARLTLTRNSNGQVVGFVLGAQRVRGIAFQKQGSIE